MIKWKPVRKMSLNRITLPDWSDPEGSPWGAAERMMKESFLPSLVICRQLADPRHSPGRFTRRHQWVIAGALETLRLVTGDYDKLQRELKGLRLEAMREKKW